jgi:anaerobic ribonucleoside-triphosphate reductase
MKKNKEKLEEELELLENAKKAALKGENGQPCEVYSRIVGYYRAISNFNPGMKQRFDDQKYYKV